MPLECMRRGMITRAEGHGSEGKCFMHRKLPSLGLSPGRVYPLNPSSLLIMRWGRPTDMLPSCPGSNHSCEDTDIGTDSQDMG